MNAKVSVIIPNYNYGRFIGEAIESVLAQTYQPIEIIVVDDGSCDDSIKIIESFEGKVKLIKQANGGVGKARNTGAKNSSGDFLAFLDADDIWLPEKIEKQIKLFQSSGEIGLATTAMQEFDKSGKILFKYIEGKNGWCADDLLILESIVVGPGSTALVKRPVFEQVGGFDEDREMHPSEDWEFCYRVARKFKLAFLPEILVRYRNHGDNVHLKISRFERSVLLAFEKTFSNNSPEIQNLKTQAYGNLHKVLAGSYLQSGQYFNFLRNLLLSLWFRPSFFGFYLSLGLHRTRKIFRFRKFE